MRPQRRKLMMMMMMVVVVMVVASYSTLSVLSPTQEVNTPGVGGGGGGGQAPTEEERRKITKEEEEEEEEERKRKSDSGRGTQTEEEEEEKQKKKPEEEEEEERKKKTTKEKAKGGGGGGGGGKKIIRKDFWVDEMESYLPFTVNVEETDEEMRRRRRRVEERCGEVLTEEERKRDINSHEFLISKRYNLIWCNVFKAASSTWMYNFLRMGGKTPQQLSNLKISPVEAARQLYPRPSPKELRGYLGKSGGGGGDAGEGYLSFIIVRDPFQRLLSAFRDKIEKEIPFYRPLRCRITQKYAAANGWGLLASINKCSPTFPQFVDYVLGVEREGGAHNEHWAPYYRFCTPCSTHFDLILRFETLHRDETYLLEKVPGLSQVVSPKVMHSSHANYSALLATYFSSLTPGQMLGLVKMYLPDFRLFGYDERPYIDLVV